MKTISKRSSDRIKASAEAWQVCSIVSVCFWVMGGAEAVAKLEGKHTDLKKLSDPVAGVDEAARLAGCDGKFKMLTGCRLLECPQRNGSAALHTLLVDSEYITSDPMHGTYAVENPEELFGVGKSAARMEDKPLLERCHEIRLMVFEERGNEIFPFGGNTMLNHGYFCDFNADGVLERADSIHYSFHERNVASVEMFTLQTVERHPEKLLQVAFNWELTGSDDVDGWGYECVDEDGDGRMEIAFGPANEIDDAVTWQVVFRWDADAKKYVSKDAARNPHLRVIGNEELLALKVKSGVFGRPLDESGAAASPEIERRGYVYQSLKGATGEEMAAFFSGKGEMNRRFVREGAVPSTIPNEIRKLSPKDAAMALVNANRVPAHRDFWQLAIDDRGGIAPPESGWLVYSWQAGGCGPIGIGLRKIALQFGVEKPVLVQLESSTLNRLGPSEYEKCLGCSAKLFALSADDARFLADTVFWLDRIRSWRPQEDFLEASSDSWMVVSTSDDQVKLDLHPDGFEPRQVWEASVANVPSISSMWSGRYDHKACANFVDLLLDRGLPRCLGEQSEEVAGQGLSLDARGTDENEQTELRGKLCGALEEILTLPDLPASVTEMVVNLAGEYTLTPLLPQMKRLQGSLPPRGEEDDEYEGLESRFRRVDVNSPSRDEPEQQRLARERLIELRAKRLFSPAVILREPLQKVTERLTLAKDEQRLRDAALKEDDAKWAQTQLRRLDAEAWAEVMEERLLWVNLPEKRALFTELAAWQPKAAQKLASAMWEDEHFNLIVEVARFHMNQKMSVESDIPLLMKLAAERKWDFFRRMEAIGFLSKVELSSSDVAKFSELMVSEIQNPQVGAFSEITMRRAAIEALGSMPNARVNLDVFLGVKDLYYSEFEPLVGILARYPEELQKRGVGLEDWIRSRLKSDNLMRNDVFAACLAFDLRELAAEIRSFASESANVPDGAGASSVRRGEKRAAGGHYHMAREITAIWSELDAGTRARMWLFFAAAHPYQCNSRQFSEVGAEMRLRVEAAVREMDAETRKLAIDAALKAFPNASSNTDFVEWLKSLEA